MRLLSNLKPILVIFFPKMRHRRARQEQISKIDSRSLFYLKVFHFLQSWDFNVCSVFLIDTNFVLEAEKFISGALTALSAMVAIETPAINVLTKMDLLSERNKQLVDEFLETDTRSIVDQDETAWNEKHRKLTRAIAQVLEDYSIVKFVPLNCEDEESIDQLLLTIDTTIQYGEDLEVKDHYPEEVDPEE